MNKKIFYYFEIAGKLATKTNPHDKRKYLLGSIGIRSDGAMVSSSNSPSQKPNRYAHAEYRMQKQLDYGAIVYVARVKLGDGTFGKARPCYSCLKALKSKRVRKIYYTISNNIYGIMNLSYNNNICKIKEKIRMMKK